MQHFLLVFYVLFFATGFMGGAALLLFDMRVRSRLLKPLLSFQLLFLIGMGLIIVYVYLENLPGGLAPSVSRNILVILMGINAAVYWMVILIIRRIAPASARGKPLYVGAQIFSALAAARSLANIYVVVGSYAGADAAALLAGSPLWQISPHLISLPAMLTFGLIARGPLSPAEPRALRPLVRAYGLCAIVFAPIGLVEFAIQATGIPWLASLSLEHLFYLAWNVVSMSAAIQLFRPAENGDAMFESVPRERVEALGLSPREAEMAVMIARGLANKEIADELHISPATVRTHIYNLYQKAGARSRVELLNIVRG